MQEYATLISTVGFPIVAYLLMFLKLDKTIGSLKETITSQSALIKMLLTKEGEKIE